jgi:hypothetical protein
LKIKRSGKIRKSEIRIWNFGKLNKIEVEEKFIKEVTASIQNTQLEEVADINDIQNKIKEGINEAAGKNNRKRRKTVKEQLVW